MPLTIPLLYFYYNKIYTVNGSEKGAVSMYIGGENIYLMVGISLAVVVLCFIGSLIGMLIFKELRKITSIKEMKFF
ncbi:MAG: hypothetical protein L6U99_07650 [Clostridium sp.]|nr:MAG: hypothetical protein L6U99_07650 [Clostridium sp.]